MRERTRGVTSRKSQPTAFIIDGRDVQARKAVEGILDSIDVNVIPFHAAPPDEGDLQQVLDMVVNGIKQASVVIALLTPDEHASLHDSISGAYSGDEAERDDASGWQPRPNVLVETGIAVGIARPKMIVVKTGPIRRISDLAGILMIRLDKPGGDDTLRRAVLERTRTVPRPRRRRAEPVVVIRPRWDFHDELGQLESDLRSQLIYGNHRTLFDAVRLYVSQNPEPAAWASSALVDFCYQNFERFADEQYTNAVFWHLINFGLLAFDDVLSDWDADAKQLWWADLLEHVTLTARARGLFAKIAAVGTA